MLFRSAARAYGRRVVGVVLSGALSDGALGLASIKLHAGLAIVQDPTEAAFDSMPTSALQATTVDYCAPAATIAGIIDNLTREPLDEVVSERMDTHPDQAGRAEEPADIPGVVDDKGPGRASGLT